VHNDRTIANNKQDRIIRENEKRTCMIIDVAMLRESVIYTFSVKRINHHSINREMFFTELLRVCCIFWSMKKLWTSCW
jgi:hypothetical protein